jgi:hypothetical protein
VKRAISFLAVAAAMASSSSASADGNERLLAKQAYDRGLEAHKRGDFRKAADEFARADALSPSPIALRAALDSALEADDAALGAELLERSKREAAPPAPLTSSISAARVRFDGRAGRIRVRCSSGSICAVKLDDKPIDAEKVVWARTGQHTVLVQVDGGEVQTKSVEVSADQVIEISPGAKGSRDPAPIARAVSPEELEPLSTTDAAASKERNLVHRLPPMFFYGGVGLTVLLAGMTTYFALDTSSTHESFSNAGCGQSNLPQCADLQADGQSSQHLTNVGLVSTAVVGVATAVVGLVLTDWRAPFFGVRAGGANAAWRAQF